MSYTYGYIKEAALLNLQIDEREANTLGHLNRFPFAINEALSQIASTIKPDKKVLEVQVATKQYRDWLETQGEAVSNLVLTDEIIVMPADFLEFGDAVNHFKEVRFDPFTARVQELPVVEATDEEFTYIPYNKIKFFKQGFYRISYNAYWPVLDAKTDNNYVLPWPRDISECLPAYIAYKCFKLDNEEKAAIWRQEFELLFSRIARANYQNTRTFRIAGDW